MPKLANLTLAAVLVATAFAAFAPTAGATAADTTVAVKVSPYETPIKPLSGFASIPITIEYTFTAGVAVVPTKIDISVSEAPPWATVSVSPSTVYLNVVDSASPGATVTRTTQSKMLISTTADAPAFSPANVKITATAATNGDLKGSSGSDSTLITADFFSILDAQAATTIQIARPQTEVRYPITITNLGNANTKVFFEVTAKPEGWQVQEPIPIQLEARQAGGKQTQATVNLNILTPYHNGYLNEVGAVTMKVTSNYALDSKSKGDSTQVSVLTTTKGFYVPGFEVFALLGAVAAVALGLRRRG